MTRRTPELRRYALFALAIAAVLLFRPARDHLRAASLLVRFADANAKGALAELDRHPVDAEAAMLALPGGGAVRVRTYVPRGVSDPPGVVLLHGVHRLGIDEPRLVRFATTVAASGVVVMTPELHELTDYRIDAASVPVIGAAAKSLHARTRRARGVGVMGMSFAGGLALIAAADESFAKDIAFVLAVGAHDDLARVLRFFTTAKVVRPDGGEEEMQPHEYGILVLVYSHVEAFFAPEDVVEAREALRMWLWEDRETAQRRIANLSPAGRAKMKLLEDHDLKALAPELQAEIARQKDRLAAVSPSAHAKSVHAPVLLLHGAGDSVIPPAETLWLARDFATTEHALVSSAIQHVELHGEPSALDQWRLVHFMAEVLEAADRE
jgi:dienelactone hydrolase